MASRLHNALVEHPKATMTFGEVSWLLLGAALGGVAAYAIAAGITLVERLMHRALPTDEALPPPESSSHLQPREFLIERHEYSSSASNAYPHRGRIAAPVLASSGRGIMVPTRP
jgi:hypothetical protein